MDMIVGAGKIHGCDPIAFLKEKKKDFVVVVDKNPNTPAIKRHKLKKPDKIIGKGGFFIQGDVSKALSLFEELKPEYVFPTSPVHIVTELTKIKFNLERWDEAISPILPYLPASVVLRAGRGELVLSFNRDKNCVKKCGSPEVFTSAYLGKNCTMDRVRPCTMDQLMRYACPDAFVLFSQSMAPSLGAYKGEEIFQFFKWAEKKEHFVLGTSCNCHGIFWGFRKTKDQTDPKT
ncbi:MAG: hypothetical protein NWF00_03900 [Candidatus Bathyarchaeota archaeon]|nr:hypothetical protein [Candidatus Bathyarchaeota archaeon]